jgi:hypothetical protein
MLLEEREALLRFNGLRSPDGWKRLSGKTVAGRVSGTAKEILERWARELGMTLDAGAAPSAAAAPPAAGDVFLPGSGSNRQMI